MKNLKDVFVVRPANIEETEYMITIGNHLATEEKFKTKKAAEMRINKTDWNLVTAMFYALKEADNWIEENKDVLENNEETEE